MSEDLVKATIEASFAFVVGAEVSFDRRVDVSLDCVTCGRTGRTVVFDTDAGTARCTSRRGDHPFVGEARGPEVESMGGRRHVRYSVRYATGAFCDLKEREPAVAHPTWARIGFEIVCPRCGRAQRQSVQNNAVLPWTSRCACGCELYRQEVEQPVFCVFGADGSEVYRCERSTYELRVFDPAGIPRMTRWRLRRLGWVATDVLAESGGVAYEHDAFAISDGQRFSRHLERVVWRLVGDGVAFQILHSGRDLRASYVKRGD